MPKREVLLRADMNGSHALQKIRNTRVTYTEKSHPRQQSGNLYL